MIRYGPATMNRAVLSVARRQTVSRTQCQSKIQFPRKNLSTTKSGDGAGKSAAEAEEARQQVLHDANEKMKTYHHARLAKLRGELPSKNKSGPESNMIQIGVVLAFLAAFAASPFLGRKIAQDKEFREKYIPSWYGK